MRQVHRLLLNLSPKLTLRSEAPDIDANAALHSQRKIRHTGALAIGGEIGRPGLDPLHISGREDGLRSEVLR